jgi:hypothetical protein
LLPVDFEIETWDPRIRGQSKHINSILMTGVKISENDPAA